MRSSRSAQSARRILVVQLQGLGDTILATPAMQLIRDAWPHAELTLAVASEASASCVRGSAIVDDIMLCDGRSLRARVAWLRRIRRQRFDVALVATRQAPGLAVALRSLAGIPIVVADSPSGNLPFGIRSRANSATTTEHRVRSNCELVALLTERSASLPPAPTFPLSADSRRAAMAYLARLRSDTPTVWIGVHPGSEPRSPQKRYPKELLLATLIAALERDPRNCALLFFGGEVHDDRAFFSGAHPRLFVVEDESLAMVAGLIGQCSVFLSGDTGLGHIAAALDVPVVTVAGPTLIESTHPWGGRNTIIRTDMPLACMPCYGTKLYGHCSHLSCMRSVVPTTVAEALIAYLASDVRAGP